MFSYRGAALNVESADRTPVVHGIKGSHFVDAHGRHLEYPCNLIHDADACETVLALSEVKERHDGGFLVLAGVSADDLLDELFILGRELERYRGVVLGCVAVLGNGQRNSSRVKVVVEYLPQRGHRSQRAQRRRKTAIEAAVPAGGPAHRI